MHPLTDAPQADPPIVAFYRGQPDYLGRTLGEIWSWDFDRLEQVHNYIQLLFPTREPSNFNPLAPTLDEASIAEFHRDSDLRRRLDRSFELMLRFYGLKTEPSGRIVLADNFHERAANWINRRNHNYLRITRILHCLRELGLSERAEAFLDCLEEIYQRWGDEIGRLTLQFWRAAAQGMAPPNPWVP
jgi:hypothetical protein